jgi:hypothetical protein
VAGSFGSLQTGSDFPMGWIKPSKRRPYHGDKSPDATPYMRRALAAFAKQQSTEPPALDSDALYQDQIRFGREQVKADNT